MYLPLLANQLPVLWHVITCLSQSAANLVRYAVSITSKVILTRNWHQSAAVHLMRFIVEICVIHCRVICVIHSGVICVIHSVNISVIQCCMIWVSHSWLICVIHHGMIYVTHRGVIFCDSLLDHLCDSSLGDLCDSSLGVLTCLSQSTASLITCTYLS